MKTLSKIFSWIFLLIAITGIWVFLATTWLGRARFDYLILGGILLWLSWIFRQDSKKEGS
jgi:hypothetical protein